MAASKGPHSSTTRTERELENAASSNITVKPDQHSVGVHPAFYIAYRISLHADSTKRKLMQKQDMDRSEFECHSLQQMDSLERTFWQVSLNRNKTLLPFFDAFADYSSR